MTLFVHAIFFPTHMKKNVAFILRHHRRHRHRYRQRHRLHCHRHRQTNRVAIVTLPHVYVHLRIRGITLAVPTLRAIATRFEIVRNNGEI